MLLRHSSIKIIQEYYGKLQAPILKSQISNLKFHSTIIPFCKLEPGIWSLEFVFCHLFFGILTFCYHGPGVKS